MALDDTDRRRFFLAAIVSMLALPALWWVNRDDQSAGPNLATAGVEIAADAATAADDVTTTLAESNLPPLDTTTGSAPVFLDGPVPNAVGVTEIAIPAGSSDSSILTTASYRSSISGSDVCLSKTVTPGREITVVNLDNNRMTTCRVGLAPATQVEELVMHTDLFVVLADLTDAPIPVEVRP